MSQKPSFEDQRVERYMIRINKLLKNQQVTHSPFKVSSPKKIKTQGPMVGRMDTFISYEQNFIFLHRIFNFRIRNYLLEGFQSLKQNDRRLLSLQQPRISKSIKIIQTQAKEKSAILVYRIMNAVQKQIKYSFVQIKFSPIDNIIKRQPSPIKLEEGLSVPLREFGKKKIVQAIIGTINNRMLVHFGKLRSYQLPISQTQQNIPKQASPKINKTDKYKKFNSFQYLGSRYHERQISSILNLFQKISIFRHKRRRQIQNQLFRERSFLLLVGKIIKSKLASFKMFTFHQLNNHIAENQKLLSPRSPQKSKQPEFKKQIRSLSKLTETLSNNIIDIYRKSFQKIHSLGKRSLGTELGMKLVQRVFKKSAFRTFKKLNKDLDRQRSKTNYCGAILSSIQRKIYVHKNASFALIKAMGTHRYYEQKTEEVPLKCATLFARAFVKIYQRRMGVFFLQILNTNNQELKESCSTFIYDQIFEFLDRQNQFSLELNRYCETIHSMLGVSSPIRLYESSEGLQRITQIKNKLL